MFGDCFRAAFDCELQAKRKWAAIEFGGKDTIKTLTI
jgi:hypothetical protein